MDESDAGDSGSDDVSSSGGASSVSNESSGTSTGIQNGEFTDNFFQ